MDQQTQQDQFHDVITLMDMFAILKHRKKLFFIVLFLGWILTGIVAHYNPVKYNYTGFLEPAYYYDNDEKVYFESNELSYSKIRAAMSAQNLITPVGGPLSEVLTVKPLENTPLFVFVVTASRQNANQYLKLFPALLTQIHQQQSEIFVQMQNKLTEEVNAANSVVSEDQIQINKLQSQLAQANLAHAPAAQPNDSVQTIHQALNAKQQALMADSQTLQQLIAQKNSLTPARFISDIVKSLQPVGIPDIAVIIFGVILSIVAGIGAVFLAEAIVATKRAISVNLK